MILWMKMKNNKLLTLTQKRELSIAEPDNHPGHLSENSTQAEADPEPDTEN